MAYVFLLAIALVIFFRSTTSVERRKYLFAVLKRIDLFFFHAQRYWKELEPFRARLRERTRFAPVTPTIALLNLAVLAGMIFHPHLLNDPDPLVSWGASFGPRTANGEWWRLITTLFVHASVLDLVINLVALIPLGLLLERIVSARAVCRETVRAPASISARRRSRGRPFSGRQTGTCAVRLTSWTGKR